MNNKQKQYTTHFSCIRSFLYACFVLIAVLSVNITHTKAEDTSLPTPSLSPAYTPSPSPGPAAPSIELSYFMGDTEVSISNFSYYNIYNISITNNNNPAEVITGRMTSHSINVSGLGMRYYGDYSITVNITNQEGNILATSNTLTYSRHVTLTEVNNTTDKLPALYASGMSNDTKYSVYRSAGNTSNFTKVADLVFDSNNDYYDYYDDDSYDDDSGNSAGLVYIDKWAVPGVTYYYQVQAYETGNNGLVYADNMSNTVSGVSEPGDDLEATINPDGYIRITFDRYDYSSYVESLTLYRALEGETSFSKVKTIEDSYSPEWIDKNVKLGNTYYYIVVIKGRYEDKILNPAKVLCTFGQAKISHKTVKPTKMKVSWKKVNKASGYKVYLRKPGKSDYKYYKSFKGGKLSFSMKVSNGKQYGIKVIAYGSVNGTMLTGSESTYEPYGDYYGFANEPYESKQNRVYKGFKKSSSWSVIDKRMTTIKIKVWDFKSGMSGPKVTKTKYLTCHKRLAPTLKKIFATIYKGKEKAPIYEVGGYSRRSGEHGNGMAVDINSNYNAMFDNGKPTAGSYWNPKKYAYSIKRYGDIEKAFEKYGFRRGFWGDRADYMHFSYFGT